MANTYTAISTVTVGSGGASSIDFSSIPGTYTDLQLILSIRTDTATSQEDIGYRFNGDTGNNYSFIYLYGQNSSSGSLSYATQPKMYAGLYDSDGNTANTFGSGQIYIPNYAGSSYKSSSAEAVAEQNGTTGWTVMMLANLWSSTSAITSISIFSITANKKLNQYSTATLYGIKNTV